MRFEMVFYLKSELFIFACSFHRVSSVRQMVHAKFHNAWSIFLKIYTWILRLPQYYENKTVEVNINIYNWSKLLKFGFEITFSNTHPYQIGIFFSLFHFTLKKLICDWNKIFWLWCNIKTTVFFYLFFKKFIFIHTCTSKQGLGLYLGESFFIWTGQKVYTKTINISGLRLE